MSDCWRILRCLKIDSSESKFCLKNGVSVDALWLWISSNNKLCGALHSEFRKLSYQLPKHFIWIETTRCDLLAAIFSHSHTGFNWTWKSVTWIKKFTWDQVFFYCGIEVKENCLKVINEMNHTHMIFISCILKSIVDYWTLNLL